MFENNIFYWRNKTKRHYIKIFYLLKIILMKKLTIIILTIWTVLLSWCWANQKQVSSENKNLSQEKVVVNSWEKVKNLTKHDNLVDNTKQEKQAVKTDKKQDNEVWTVKTLVANTEENKPKQNEANKQNETDDTEVTVEYKIQELTDYNHCLISKEDFENMQKVVDKLFSWANNYNIISDLKYKDLCLPKYKLIWTIKRWDPDTITVESCHDWKPYTLKNFKKWDKKFEYNIAYVYGNVCNVKNNEYSSEPDYSSIYYQVNFYKDWKKLNEINSKKPLFDPNKENIIYKQWDKVCKIGGPKCWEVKNNYLKKVEFIDWFEEYKLISGKYKKFNYIMFNHYLWWWNSEEIKNYVYFPKNKDLFVLKEKSYWNIKLSNYLNVNDKSNQKKYLSEQGYKKYVKNWYKLFFLWKLDKNFTDNLWNDFYLTNIIFTWYTDNQWFTKIICKNNQINNFWTNIPIIWIEAYLIEDILKVSVWENLLKQLNIDTKKEIQDITNYKNLKEILTKLYLNRIYLGCNESFNKNCKSILPWFPTNFKNIESINGKEWLNTYYNFVIDKSKIKKVILKLKSEHYPFWEERYLYEVWINWKKISAEKYFKKKY